VAAVEPELAWTTALRCAVPEIPEEVVSRRGRLVEQAADGRAAVLTRVISVEPPGEDDETSGGAPPGGWTMPGASAVSRPTGGSAR